MLARFFGWIAMNAPVGAAVIAAITSVLVATLTNWLQPWSQRKLEILKGHIQAGLEEEKKKADGRLAVEKAALDDGNNAAAARRAYEYEARKRLYEEVEPLLFQLHEALEEAHYRVRSLARTGRQGDLSERSWLGERGYYLCSTVYKLLVPAVHFRLMQRRVTFVDLTLDASIALRYRLMKLYVRSYTDDFLFAELPPTLEYAPHDEITSAERKKAPAKYDQQGLPLGVVEAVADLMTVLDNEKSRAMQFGEFEARAEAPDLNANLDFVLTGFTNFSPQRKPVLARLLVVQACLAQLVLSTYRATTTHADLLARLDQMINDDGLRSALSFDDEPADLSFVHGYLAERLDWLATDASWIEKDRPRGASPRGERTVASVDAAV